MTPDEIEELRQFRADLATPSPARLARIHARLTERAATSPRRATHALAVPALVAASVLVVAVGAGLIALNSSSTPTTPGPPARSTIRQVPDPSSHPEPTPALPAPHQAAVDMLERLAGWADTGTPPLTVPAGKLLYVRTNGQEPPDKFYEEETWVDPNEGVSVMIRRSVNGQLESASPDPRNPNDNYVSQQRAELAADGPGFRHATPAFRTALPTTPEDMYRLLTQQATSGGDRMVMTELAKFLHVNEPLLSSEARAILYRALARIPSITTGFAGDGGIPAYTFGQTERGERFELIVDAQTYHIVGTRSVVGTTYYPSRWTYAVVAKAGDTG